MCGKRKNAKMCALKANNLLLGLEVSRSEADGETEGLAVVVQLVRHDPKPIIGGE